jgi:anti-sigma B factor antagonist
VIDLSRATYIDSAGVAALILAMQEVEAYGGKLFLSGLRETVRLIFETSRLDRVFRIVPDVDAALMHQASHNFSRTRERLSFTVRSTV